MREFPKKDIDYFIDVFAGSGIVGLSYKSPKKIFLNDSDI
jgi:adenine-specific DNA methylase